MLFNSFEFLIFLPIVFLLYWFVFDYAMRGCKRQLLWQNLLIVVASYIFYGWWDWRFLILIAITTILSFLSGIGIEKAPTQRGKKAVMIANVVVNLGILVLRLLCYTVCRIVWYRIRLPVIAFNPTSGY